MQLVLEQYLQEHTVWDLPLPLSQLHSTRHLARPGLSIPPTYFLLAQCRNSLLDQKPCSSRVCRGGCLVYVSDYSRPVRSGEPRAGPSLTPQKRLDAGGGGRGSKNAGIYSCITTSLICTAFASTFLPLICSAAAAITGRRYLANASGAAIAVAIFVLGGFVVTHHPLSDPDADEVQDRALEVTLL